MHERTIANGRHVRSDTEQSTAFPEKKSARPDAPMTPMFGSEHW
jgi:hypothetical protein